MKCGICGSEKTETVFGNMEGYYYRGHHFSINRCFSCHGGFLYPQVLFTEVEGSCYADEYHAYQDFQKEEGWPGKMKRVIKQSALCRYLGYGTRKFLQFLSYPFFLRMSFYPRFVPNGKILDIGCGIGKYLHYLKALGWDVYGVDISERAVKKARSSGLRHIVQGELERAGFQDNFFDVVNMHHVLEHLPDPNKILRETRRVLKPGGEVIITLPNFSSLAFRVFGRYWGGMDVPRHLFHFNRKSLEFVLAKNGFEVSEVWYSDTFRGFSAGLSYLLFSDARSKEKYFLPFGIALDLVFDPILQMTGWGDQITVKAKKK